VWLKSFMLRYFDYWSLHKFELFSKLPPVFFEFSGFRLKTIKRCSHFIRFELCLNSKRIREQLVKTSAKQEKFYLGPPFSVFKHRKLFYSLVTKHTLYADNVAGDGEKSSITSPTIINALCKCEFGA
jgi:hypothetical protein